MTTNNKQNLRPIHSSSSSSTNTYLRQTLLKSEIKHLNNHLASPENLLGDISYTNIRFLQELGEGKIKKKKIICWLINWENFISGDYGRIYKGELIDSSNKCIIKTLQTEYATQQNREEYSREIESKKNKFI